MNNNPFTVDSIPGLALLSVPVMALYFFKKISRKTAFIVFGLLAGLYYLGLWNYNKNNS